MILPQTLLGALESAINKALSLDREGLEKFSALAGKLFCFNLQSIDTPVYLRADGNGIKLSAQDTGIADAGVQAAPFTLLRLLKNKEEEITHAAMQIHGDVEAVRTLFACFRFIRIDWEEQLSRFTGDMAARRLSNLGRGFLAWKEQSQNAFEENLSEYLSEELRVVPGRNEIEAFSEEVSELVHRLEILEKRVQAL